MFQEAFHVPGLLTGRAEDTSPVLVHNVVTTAHEATLVKTSMGAFDVAVVVPIGVEMVVREKKGVAET